MARRMIRRNTYPRPSFDGSTPSAIRKEQDDAKLDMLEELEEKIDSNIESYAKRTEQRKICDVEKIMPETQRLYPDVL